MYSYKVERIHGGVKSCYCHAPGLADLMAGRASTWLNRWEWDKCNFTAPTKLSSKTRRVSAMVKSTTIVRASDSLPLAASVDDEEVSFVLCHILRLKNTSFNPH